MRLRAQIRCGDLYADAVVKNFNTCAVTTKKCVPQRANEGLYPVPKPEALVKEFNTADFTGRWYISAGLNPLFDTFDCQVRRGCPRVHTRGKAGCTDSAACCLPA